MAKGVKLGAKIALDVVMFLILVFLYKAKVLTLTYHEVAGIGILLVFLIHCLFNWRWIANNAKKLFSKETPARVKFSYWISIALVVSFLLIVISGVFISKVLFKAQIESLAIDTSVFRTIHLFFSAVSLILVGIHIGLYWGMVKGFFKKKWKVPEAIAKPVCYVLLAVIVIFGAYSVPTSGFGQWLICPVVPMHHGHGDHGEKGAQGGEETEQASEGHGDREGAAENKAEGEASTEQDERSGRGDREATADDTGAEGERADRGDRDDAAEEKAERGDRESASDEQGASDERGEKSGKEGKDGKGGNHGNNITPSNVALTFAQFTSIMGLFAAITYYINEALRRRRAAKKE